MPIKLFGRQFGGWGSEGGKRLAMQTVWQTVWWSGQRGRQTARDANCLTDSLVVGAARAAHVSRCKLFDRQFGGRGTRGRHTFRGANYLTNSLVVGARESGGTHLAVQTI